jgi:phosphatidylserine/phosphatidylglycerophosphate/cardiolipin synthase-like enzyme
MAAAMRSNFHPKCLLVDGEEALVTSANFTMAAQKKNVEVGVNRHGQYAKAEPLYKRALAIREKTLGPEHPDVATCLESYALCLRAMDRPEEAASLETRVRAIRAKAPD